MKKAVCTYFIVLIITFLTFGCGPDKQLIQGETEWQKSMNAKFKDASTSPLLAKDLKEFNGLDFFGNDSTFVVEAVLERTPDTDFFNMETTTSRLSEERIFGIIKFKIKNQDFKLNVYQGKENMETAGYEDYLFLPFLDLTNGGSTYGGGRYIDLRIPDGDTLTIDFNKAYSPYCVYNEGFSCPIVPRTNFLDVKIEAGMKIFNQ